MYPDLGVLISNKIYNKLTTCNYFVLQTWYLPEEYHGSFIYKKPLRFSDHLTPDSVKRTR